MPSKEYTLPAGMVLKGNHGSYELSDVLGRGGFGIVYTAVRQGTNERVCVKEFFRIQAVTRDSNGYVCPLEGKKDQWKKGIADLRREAETLEKLKENASTVNVVDFFEANDTAYMVMEFIDGVSLRKLVETQGRMKPEELLPLVEELIPNLQRMHDMGLVHRDINPSNLMLANGRLVLIDFGSARRYDGQHLTEMLTDRFAPVEQYTSKGQGPYTDVYGLCATIYYCLTAGFLPIAPERLEGRSFIPPLKNTGIIIRPEVERALHGGLAVQPRDRLQSMNALLEAMHKKDKPWELLLEKLCEWKLRLQRAKRH